MTSRLRPVPHSRVGETNGSDCDRLDSATLPGEWGPGATSAGQKPPRPCPEGANQVGPGQRPGEGEATNISARKGRNRGFTPPDPTPAMPPRPEVGSRLEWRPFR